MTTSGQAAGRPAAVRLGLGAAPGVLLQLAGVILALRPGAGEVELLIGVCAAAVGTPLAMLVIERHAMRIGRRDRWALLALLGPIGLGIAARLAPRAPTARRRRPMPRTLADRVVAVVVVVVLSVALLWGAARWLRGYAWPFEVDSQRVAALERRAYERILEVAAAQATYRQRDWDGDGELTYAPFLIHLWQSVDLAGNPVPVGLVSRELGFAMVREFALDGYTFESLHVRAASPEAAKATSAERRRGLRELDPAEEWAAVARPAFPRRTGGLTFLTDSTGAVWVAPSVGAARLAYPGDPDARGWIRVRSADELAAVQANRPHPGPRRAPR